MSEPAAGGDAQETLRPETMPSNGERDWDLQAPAYLGAAFGGSLPRGRRASRKVLSALLVLIVVASAGVAAALLMNQRWIAVGAAVVLALALLSLLLIALIASWWTMERRAGISDWMAHV